MRSEAQRDARFKQRVPCRLSVAGRSTVGFVLNVSRAGLFVQTSAMARHGERVIVRLDPADNLQPIEITAKVVWRRTVVCHLPSIVQGGMGLAIRNPPASYLEFLLGSVPRGPVHARLVEEATATDTTEKTFLMRVRWNEGPRTRKLYVQATNEDDARRRVLERFGPGWTILVAEEA